MLRAGALSSVSAAVKPEPIRRRGRVGTADGEVGLGRSDRGAGGGSGCVKMPVASTRCVAWSVWCGGWSVSVKPEPEEARETRVTVTEVCSVDEIPAAEGYAAKYAAA